MSLQNVGVRKTAGKKPMSQSWPILSEEEDGGGKEEAASEDEVRPSR
jgi:hypothetical protein